MKDGVSASVTLNEDLNLISNWAYTGKMSFNPDPSKQAKEITFSKKRSDTQLPVLIFNNSNSIISLRNIRTFPSALPYLCILAS